ncbi:MAG: thioredoxin domain-containing protein [Bacteroidota bacterium]
MAKSEASKARKPRAKNIEGPLPRRPVVWALVAVSLVGMGLAWYALQVGFRVEASGITTKGGCNVNDWINCDAAQASSYAKVFSIPVAWLGFLFYAWAGLAGLFAAFSSDRSRVRNVLLLTLVLAVGGVLYSFVKAYQLYTLGTLCLVCVAMYVVNFAILGLLLAVFSRKTSETVQDSVNYVKGFFAWPSNIGSVPVIAFVVLFAVGLMGMRNYVVENNPEADLDLDLALRAHFRQQPVELDIPEDASVWGNPEAGIVIVDYSDFQCPACKTAAQHLRGAIYEFRDEVQFVYMNFPLDKAIMPDMERQIHQFAGLAAMAGVCAEQQGDFWDVHDEIFEQQQTLSARAILDIAEGEGLDMTQFQQCIRSPETLARVRADVASGRAANVSRTPTLFINGRQVQYWNSDRFLRAVIERELAG